jgi:hypothetical protein
MEYELMLSLFQGLLGSYDLDPDPHQDEQSDPHPQIKIRIRIRIRVISRIRIRINVLRIHNTDYKHESGSAQRKMLDPDPHPRKHGKTFLT